MHVWSGLGAPKLRNLLFWSAQNGTGIESVKVCDVRRCAAPTGPAAVKHSVYSGHWWTFNWRFPP